MHAVSDIYYIIIMFTSHHMNKMWQTHTSPTAKMLHNYAVWSRKFPVLCKWYTLVRNNKDIIEGLSVCSELKICWNVSLRTWKLYGWQMTIISDGEFSTVSHGIRSSFSMLMPRVLLSPLLRCNITGRLLACNIHHSDDKENLFSPFVSCKTRSPNRCRSVFPANKSLHITEIYFSHSAAQRCLNVTLSWRVSPTSGASPYNWVAIRRRFRGLPERRPGYRRLFRISSFRIQWTMKINAATAATQASDSPIVLHACLSLARLSLAACWRVTNRPWSDHPPLPCGVGACRYARSDWLHHPKGENRLQVPNKMSHRLLANRRGSIV